MRKNRRIWIHTMLLLFAVFGGLLLSGQRASAASVIQNYLTTENGLKGESAVNDYAGIYKEEEIKGFEEKMQQMREEYDCNVVAFIIDDPDWNSSEFSAPEETSEQYLNLDAHKSTVVLWLNIHQGNRSLYILGYGSAEYKITDSDADHIAKELQSYVVKQQSDIHGTAYGENALYVEMMDKFIEAADVEMRTPYFFLAWWFHLLIGVIVATVVVMSLLRSAGGKMTADGKTYMNQAFSSVIGRQDIYTHTTYVRTKRSSGSSGGGGGGHSHSRGGGRF